MLTCGIIGIGNAGSQVASLGNVREGFAGIAINTSENDLATVKGDILKFPIGDLRGAGKNRTEAKETLKTQIKTLLQSQDLISFMDDKDVVFIVGSTGGGTGSGIAPILTQIIKKAFPSTMIILIGILPSLKESYAAQINTLDYMNEIYTKVDRLTYMIYDNTKIKASSHIVMSKVNESIISDIKVLIGTYNNMTEYASIDEKDASVILSKVGRIVVASYENIKEQDLDDKPIETTIYDIIKKGNHAELQWDKVIRATGIIANLSDKIMDKFDDNLTELRGHLGTSADDFSHIALVSEKAIPSSVYFIASGLSAITNRVDRITERVEELEAIYNEEDDSIDDSLASVDIDEANKKRQRETVKHDESVDISAIFDDFA